jgi:hypothetical protein
MGHWAHESRSKPKDEQAHVMQDEEEASLMLTSATLIHPEVISSSAEVEIHKKESDAGTWVQDTGTTKHLSGCRAVFTKIDTAVLGTVHFGDDSVAWNEGCRTVMFMCKER